MAKNNQVFADSNFFIALFNPSDTLHAKAIAISQKLAKEKPKFYISNFVFLEIVTVLTQKVSRKAAITLGEHLIKDQQLKIIHINQRLNKLTWEIFKTLKRKNISFVDCSLLTVMRAEGIKKLLTFDKEDFTRLRKKYRFSFYP